MAVTRDGGSVVRLRGHVRLYIGVFRGCAFLFESKPGPFVPGNVRKMELVTDKNIRIHAQVDYVDNLTFPGWYFRTDRAFVGPFKYKREGIVELRAEAKRITDSGNRWW